MSKLAKIVKTGRTTNVVEALGRTWQWPAEDTECWPVIFDWSPDLETVFSIVERSGKLFQSCVQAGGNMGVWPAILARRFTDVYTFEPDPRCFPYLVENVRNQANVYYYQAALGSRREHVSMTNLSGEETNLGAQYPERVDESQDGIPTIRIDDLGLSNCDLICLDIEGYELFALQGGFNTIEKCKPVIVVEDKGLSEKFGYAKGEIEKDLYKWFGYEVVARPHRDVVLRAPN